MRLIVGVQVFDVTILRDKTRVVVLIAGDWNGDQELAGVASEVMEDAVVPMSESGWSVQMYAKRAGTSRHPERWYSLKIGWIGSTAHHIELCGLELEDPRVQAIKTGVLNKLAYRGLRQCLARVQTAAGSRALSG